MARPEHVDFPLIPFIIHEGPDPVLFSGGKPLCTIWGGRVGNFPKGVAQLFAVSPVLYSILDRLERAFPELDTGKTLNPDEAVEILKLAWPEIKSTLRRARGWKQ